MANTNAVKTHAAKLTPVSNTKPEMVSVDDSARLREIRALVATNNRSSLSNDTIICQIYMESRFDKDAKALGSSARGLMQLLKAPVRELARLNNLKKPRKERRPERDIYRDADAFHDNPEFVDEARNIQTGTQYLQALIDNHSSLSTQAAIEEAFKDYRGVRNGIYYRKIKTAAERLTVDPDNMQILREMVK
ncbi:transglycosylase SLT domain-containing protein [Pseudoduganella sp. FT93W]|uniref:Transglycosylase SLT domain-containing protein n=1 Tax=Duganella fentianensis TaxID=2692177 RepID=A0A845HRF4_9BURK|nr:transglycosylase SLT domain-containing protein [Duganella fentianensis]MYN44034.1 transglycosylase SLT domain-containing protein [Duganella fentianensis]